ncbi:MAG: hypothetical protein V4650_14045 [Pseudomonadota bacterium]
MPSETSNLGTPNPQGTPTDGQSSQWVMQAVNSLTRSVGQIEGRIEGIGQDVGRVENRLGKISDDIRDLNRKIWIATGVISTVFAIASGVLYFAANVFSGVIKESIRANQPVIEAAASTADESPRASKKNSPK